MAQPTPIATTTQLVQNKNLDMNQQKKLAENRLVKNMQVAQQTIRTSNAVWSSEENQN